MAGVKVFWTVLPNGKTSDGKVKVSVAVSFQLSGAAKLKDYPKIEQLPATLAKLIAKVRLDFGTALATVVRDPDSSPVDPQLWTQLFPGSTPVGATTQLNAVEAVPSVLRSFPTTLVHSHLKDLYRKTGVEAFRSRTAADWAEPVVPSGGGPPPNPDPDPRGWPMPSLLKVRDEVSLAVSRIITDPVAAYRSIDKQLGLGHGPADGGDVGINATGGGPTTINRADTTRYHEKTSAFAEVMRFYDRTDRSRPPQQADPAEPAASPSEPELDFHAAVTLAGDYPELLRRRRLRYRGHPHLPVHRSAPDKRDVGNE